MEKQSWSRSALLGGCFIYIHFIFPKEKEKKEEHANADMTLLFFSLLAAASLSLPTPSLAVPTTPFHSIFVCVCLIFILFSFFSLLWNQSLNFTTFQESMCQSLKITLLGSFSSFHSCIQWDKKHSIP